MQAKVFNIDPDWNTKGMIRNPLPDYIAISSFWWGLCRRESPRMSLRKRQASSPERGRNGRGNSKPTESGKTEGPAFVRSSSKCRTYQRQGNDKYIVTLPAEIEMKAEGGEAQESQSSRSSRSGRSGCLSRSRRQMVFHLLRTINQTRLAGIANHRKNPCGSTTDSQRGHPAFGLDNEWSQWATVETLPG